MNNIWQFEADN